MITDDNCVYNRKQTLKLMIMRTYLHKTKIKTCSFNKAVTLNIMIFNF